MNNIAQTFKNGKVLIPYITCGDPDLAVTADVIKTVDQTGADIIELGIPFSDPAGEPPIAQRASARALKGGVTTDKVFSMAEKLKSEIKAPFVIMTYANVVFGYGTERFLKRCQETGIKGLLLPDVPFEEKDDFAPLCRKYGVELISMIATSSGKRVRKIASEAEGFLYGIAAPDATDSEEDVCSKLKAMICEAKAANPQIPCCIDANGFELEQIQEVLQFADGIVIGAPLLRLLEEKGAEAVNSIREYIGRLKKAIG